MPVLTLIIRMLLIGVAVIVPASAQEAAKLDQQRIEDAVRSAEDEASSFALEVASRAEAYADEARTLSASVMETMATEAVPDGPGQGPLDWSALLSGAPGIAQAARQKAGSRASVMVMVSFSMPEESLRSLVVEAHKAGVPVVIRGFVDGSLRATGEAMRDVLSVEFSSTHDTQSLLGGVVLDPRAFRIFNIETVPTFVAFDGPLPDCDGLDCSAPPPPHGRITGNISLGAALQALSERSLYGRGGVLSAQERLEATP